MNGTEDSTNDIANLLGMLDPWYERNTLSLLELPVNVVCQVIISHPTQTHSHEQRVQCIIISKNNNTSFIIWHAFDTACMHTNKPHPIKPLI